MCEYRKGIHTRKEREWTENCRIHVMARGIRKMAIFKADEDYLIFMKILKCVQEKTPFELHAYCLMTNHFHLLLWCKTDPIWVIMRRLMTNYAIYFNRKYGYCGHLFESRYKSSVVKDDLYFLEASRYIHLNPVKAAMVNGPLDYHYSSYHSYMNGTENSIVNKDYILGCFGDDVEKYRMFVEGKMSHKEQELLIQKEIGEDERWLPW